MSIRLSQRQNFETHIPPVDLATQPHFPDEIEDPDSLQVKLSVQGELRQNYNTRDMAHKIPEVIEWVSWVNTLESGDVISCGTNHLELGPLQDGDQVEMEISDFGKLTVNVSDKLKRTWPRETRAQREARLNS